MLNRATALRQQAQEDMETREGEGKENRPTGTNGPLTDHESNAP